MSNIRNYLLTGLIFLLSLALLPGCGSDSEPAAPPQPGQALVQVDVTPDWAEPSWTLHTANLSVTGVGDSLVTFAEAGPCTLMAQPGNGLVLAVPSIQAISLTEDQTSQAQVAYTQQPWQTLFGLDVFARFSGILATEDGGAIVCGQHDGHPWLMRVDHDGNEVWSDIDPTLTSAGYWQLLPLDGDGFLAVGSGQDIVLSWRTGAGQEIASAMVADLSLGGIAPRPGGGYFLAGTRLLDDILYAELVTLDGAGQVLNRQILAAATSCVGAGVAAGPGEGCRVLRARLIEEGAPESHIEVLTLDGTGQQVDRIELGPGEPELSLACLPTRDGGLVVTYNTHQGSDELGSAVVARLDPAGAVQWQQELDSRGFEELLPVMETDQGNLRLAGGAWMWEPADYRVRLVEMDDRGLVLRNDEIDTGPQACQLTGMAESWDGGFILCGRYGNWHDGRQDGWLVRLDPDLTFPDLE